MKTGQQLCSAEAALLKSKPPYHLLCSNLHIDLSICGTRFILWCRFYLRENKLCNVEEGRFCFHQLGHLDEP